jgi:hypothetical protein
MFLRLVERMLVLQPVLPQPRQDPEGAEEGTRGTDRDRERDFPDAG